MAIYFSVINVISLEKKQIFLKILPLLALVHFAEKNMEGNLPILASPMKNGKLFSNSNLMPPPKNRLGCTPFDSVLAFAHKQVIAPMGTFDQKIVDEINEQIEESKKLHCPRCFSTNVETDGGYEYGSNGVGASGYGWDSGDGLVATGYRNVCKNCGYKWQR